MTLLDDFITKSEALSDLLEKKVKELRLENLTLKQNNANLKSQLKALTEENRRLRQELNPFQWL